VSAPSDFRPSSLGTIPRLVQDSASRFADRLAFEDDGRKLRFDELGALALRSARAFIAAGIQPGDRVAVWAPNQLEWVLAAVGLQSAGGVLVPMNTRFKASEAGYQLRKSGARLVFTVEEFLGERYAEMLASQELPALEGIVLFSGAHSKAESWESFLSRGDAITEGAARERIHAGAMTDLADIMFTSGTTGNPKGVMTTHVQNLRAFESWSSVVGPRPGDRYLVVNPFFHTFRRCSAGWGRSGSARFPAYRRSTSRS